MAKVFRISVCQTAVTADKNRNLLRARAMLGRAKAAGAGLAVLPEMFNCPYETACFSAYAEKVPHGPTCAMLSSAAKKLRMTVVGGSMPERDGRRLYNTSPVFDASGRLVARHRKIHLFDVSLKSVAMRESGVLSAGEAVTVFKTAAGAFGLVICYDARFPELFRLMLRKNIIGAVMPGAFSVETGSAHWKALLRMRAVDNQIYMAAASPARNRSGYRAYGHSMIVDPWGTPLAEAGARPALITAEIDLARLQKIRGRLPLLRHRRTDLYRVRAAGRSR
jgi:predicted amidohydrolase